MEEKLQEFGNWLNNNWFIPTKDGFWKLDVRNPEYSRTIKGSQINFFKIEELVTMFLNGEGEY